MVHLIVEVLLVHYLRGSLGGSEDKVSACNAGDLGSIPGSGRSPGEGNGNPLQYSCLENPMDRGSGGLQSTGSQRVRHDWATSFHFTFGRLEPQGSLSVAGGIWGQNSLFLRDLSLFFLRLSAVWMRLTHTVESHLLFPKSTDLNVNLI